MIAPRCQDDLKTQPNCTLVFSPMLPSAVPVHIHSVFSVVRLYALHTLESAREWPCAVVTANFKLSKTTCLTIMSHLLTQRANYRIKSYWNLLHDGHGICSNFIRLQCSLMAVCVHCADAHPHASPVARAISAMFHVSAGPVAADACAHAFR